MEKKLNAFLSDLVIESHKLQSFHWYVKGPEFFQAHLQLEEYYTLVNGLVDEVAEAMLSCGMKPASTCGEFLEKTAIKESKGTFITANQALNEIAKDFEHLLDGAKELKKEAEKSGDDLIGIKADTLIETFSKAVWMLNQRKQS